jgi:integrase
MNTSYDVRIWDIKSRKNRHGKITSYSVRWKVGTREFYESFKIRAQADSFRADLLSAQRAGERFDTGSGLPAKGGRKTADMSWFALTCKYVDMKWPDLAATARQTVAEALIRVLSVFVQDKPGRPDAKTVRSAARQWGYNTLLRTNGKVPADARRVLDWLEHNTSSVRTALDAEVLRELQREITRRLDGTPYAPTVARKTWAVLWNTLDYAVELGLIESNPLVAVKWTAMPKGKRKVDRRAVPNPVQARTILGVVRETPRSGERLEAFFGAMYFAGLRPEEVTALRKSNLTLPPPRWDPQKESWKYG